MEIKEGDLVELVKTDSSIENNGFREGRIYKVSRTDSVYLRVEYFEGCGDTGGWRTSRFRKVNDYQLMFPGICQD